MSIRAHNTCPQLTILDDELRRHRRIDGMPNWTDGDLMFEYELVYKLKEQMSFTNSYAFQVDLTSSVRDSSLIISPNELRFLVSRKQKVSLPAHPKNRIRIPANSVLVLSAASTITPPWEHSYQIIQPGAGKSIYPLPSICSL